MKSDRYFIKLSPNGETERIYDIGPSYTHGILRDAVGGDIRVIGTTLGVAVVMIVNEEGKLEGLTMNRHATDVAVIRSYDYIAGDAVFAIRRGEDLVGFSENDAEMVKQIFEVNKKLKEVRE